MLEWDVRERVRKKLYKGGMRGSLWFITFRCVAQNRFRKSRCYTIQHTGNEKQVRRKDQEGWSGRQWTGRNYYLISLWALSGGQQKKMNCNIWNLGVFQWPLQSAFNREKHTDSTRKRTHARTHTLLQQSLDTSTYVLIWMLMKIRNSFMSYLKWYLMDLMNKKVYRIGSVMVLYCFLTDVLAQKFIQLWKKIIVFSAMARDTCIPLYIFISYDSTLIITICVSMCVGVRLSSIRAHAQNRSSLRSNI